MALGHRESFVLDGDLVLSLLSLLDDVLNVDHILFFLWFYLIPLCSSCHSDVGVDFHHLLAVARGVIGVGDADDGAGGGSTPDLSVFPADSGADRGFCHGELQDYPGKI